jgi:hypothetical protein
MVDYSIAAIPTEYRGRTYRSRLEARWAAFFDRLGLAHEYEPFDLGAWSPDFLLTDINTLVEVKPLTEFDADVWAKAVAACRERGLLQGDNQINGLLLTLVAPRRVGRAQKIGWVAMPWRDDSMKPLHAGIAWCFHEDRPEFIPEIAGVFAGGMCTTSGDEWTMEEMKRTDLPCSYTDYTMELWARATADVQWPGPNEA